MRSRGGKEVEKLRRVDKLRRGAEGTGRDKIEREGENEFFLSSYLWTAGDREGVKVVWVDRHTLCIYNYIYI
jgi:hypothetical protein